MPFFCDFDMTVVTTFMTRKSPIMELSQGGYNL